MSLILLFITGIILLVILLSPVDDEPGLITARKAGFTDPTITDKGRFTWECGEHDMSYYRMKGKNAQKEEVGFIVCCGGLKACTVRY